jgi:hypothetical protein
MRSSAPPYDLERKASAKYKVSEFLGFWASGLLGFWVSRYLEFWVSGLLDFWA